MTDDAARWLRSVGGLGPQFRRLWAGNAFANLADGIAFVAIPLLAAALTSDPAVVAGLSLVHAVVRLVVVLPIGGLVDRWDRRTVLWAANASRALLLLVLALLVATDHDSISVLYVVFALVGVAEAAADNAALSILPALVDVSLLDRANSQVSATQLVTDEFVGPPLGSLLFAVAVALPIAVTGGLYAAAALAVVSLRGAFRPVPRLPEGSGPRPGLIREVLDGVVWLSRHRLLAALAGVGGLASVAYMAMVSILVLFSREVLGQSPAGYGFLLSVSALGGLLGSAIAAPVRRSAGYLRPGWICGRLSSPGPGYLWFARGGLVGVCGLLSLMSDCGPALLAASVER